MALKIYTKKGDEGKTSLLGGTRISKGDLRIATYGSVDTLNAYVGWAADLQKDKKTVLFLREIQHCLFAIGASLSLDPNKKKKIKLPALQKEDITLLEEAIDEINAVVSPLKNFILPGGHETISACHIVRCHCREAERNCVALEESGAEVSEWIIPYLNRLSDYFFMLARRSAKTLKVEETLWQFKKK